MTVVVLAILLIPLATVVLTMLVLLPEVVGVGAETGADVGRSSSLFSSILGMLSCRRSSTAGVDVAMLLGRDLVDEVVVVVGVVEEEG